MSKQAITVSSGKEAIQKALVNSSLILLLSLDGFPNTYFIITKQCQAKDIIIKETFVPEHEEQVLGAVQLRAGREAVQL